jgi:hypothetical protein
MRKTTRTILKASLATSLGVVATESAAAMAAPPYHFTGSDTLAGVMRDSITQSETLPPPVGLCTLGSLVYDNTGSDAAEDALLASTQRIAPMSRNFWATTLAPPHTNWAPQGWNIIGVDGVVIVEKNAASGYSKCANLSAPLDPSAPGKAQVDTLIGLVLGGKGGAGTFTACSHPDRLAAVDALAGCFGGISFIDHLYRPDDRSGTADVMKEKFRIQRFCNGRSPGLIAGSNNNLANDDADPIRRDCVGADSSHAKTACTLWPSATQCAAGQVNCTQGLVVALSQNDPGMPDITTSIARRVRLDTSDQTLGFAGREASRQIGNAAPNINGISPNNFNIQNNAYLASRLLYVNWSDIPVGAVRPGGPSADDVANDAAQMNLYTWMTDPVKGGPINVDPILIAHGFAPCTGLFCSVPQPPAETTPPPCIPSNVAGNGVNICCSTGALSPQAPAVCPPNPCSVVNAACTGAPAQGSCCTGLTCTDQGTGNFACN